MNILIFLSLILCGEAVFAQSLSDNALQQIAFDQKLGGTVSRDLSFHDENGKSVQLGDYFGQGPVILVLGYYSCPMLCTVVLNSMIGALQDIKLEMGRDYEVVNVSIDPHETPALAAAKKRSYVTRFGQPNAAKGWHFLTGDEPAIRQLAAQVGFNYAYDATLRQYAHPSGLVILTPSGKVSHYLSGVVFSGADLKQSLADAARAKVGSPIEQIFLLCFHYSPVSGKYSGLILGVVRVLGVAVLVTLVAFIAGAWRRAGLAAQKKVAP
jgi:protein SCO1/2